ncbi:hypothetical protein C0Q44_15745 [Paenibacillus sp. PCH8]|uniref:hypothetical protein n=1 Tax=Paenibacillus sp. PCH8 TaxID=2066524 RepID=UPI000CF98A65|nr:hypothetical protein [Paenibacillus sp. PCH8]PQP82834.1 hypothetical protein C0Q44_15745 [Paenibacillus sp. PCH8]
MRHVTSDLERLSFQSTRHQLIIVDHHWTIRSCNRAWQQGLIPFTPNPDMSGAPGHYLHLLETWAMRSKNVNTALAAQNLKERGTPFKQNHTYDFCIFTAYSEERWFRAELTPLPYAYPSPESDLALIAHVDITEQKKTERQLKKALSEVRTLRGLLPICAVCKHIKDEEDCWNSVESYLEKHTHAEFTHDICPECIRRLYPKYSNILDKRS